MSDRGNLIPELDFLEILGLALPVSVEDVKQAYLEKVKTAHPDKGGDPNEFQRIQQAYERATEYAQFKANRQGWLGQWVEQYADQQKLIERIKQLGGTVDVESSEWVTQSIGADFGTVLDRIMAIHLEGEAINDAVIEELFSKKRIVGSLARLELIGTSVGSKGLKLLAACANLKHLDLSRTQVNPETLQELLTHWPALETLHLADSGVGFWWRTRLGLAHRGVKING